MSFTFPTTDQSHLSFDLSFLSHTSFTKLDALPENLKPINEKYRRIGYESLGITHVTCGETTKHALSFSRIHETVNPLFITASLSKKKFTRTPSSASIASSPVDKTNPYYIRIIVPGSEGKTEKTIAAARLRNRATAQLSESRDSQEMVRSYGLESPFEIVLVEFPTLGASEKPKDGTYSGFDATAALVQSCIQLSLKIFNTSCIKAIPENQRTADDLSKLGFSYESSQERDCPQPVTATTQMILFPEVREAWEKYVRNYPICMPKSF